jgi:H+/Cl- antiporter ClcA
MSDPTEPGSAPAEAGPPPELTEERADATIASRAYVGLLLLVSVVGVIVSLAVWCFLEGTHQLQEELYVHLPHAVGYGAGPPKWWPLPVLVVGALLVALAIRRLPGDGGHIPANGLSTDGPTSAAVLPGVILAGAGTIAFGLVLGPEAPVIAIGGGLAAGMIGALRRDATAEVRTIVAAAGSFAALSFVFTSPIIAAVLLIEATALGGPKLRVVLLPGLLAAGIGSLISLGLGHFTGLSSSSFALGSLPLTAAPHLTIGQFGWTIGLAVVVGAAAAMTVRAGGVTHRFVSKQHLVVVLPVIALFIGGLAIAFAQITGHDSSEVLFSGENQLPGLVGHAGSWSISALIWLVVFKGIGYALSLGSYRGGPTFPALFLGAAAGIMASHLPGFPLQAAVAVGMGAGAVAVLRLPLSSVILAALLAGHAGDNIGPLIIVGVVVAYIVTLVLERRR